MRFSHLSPLLRRLQMTIIFHKFVLRIKVSIKIYLLVAKQVTGNLFIRENTPIFSRIFVIRKSYVLS